MQVFDWQQVGLVFGGIFALAAFLTFAAIIFCRTLRRN
jgi:hypothetical protein